MNTKEIRASLIDVMEVTRIQVEEAKSKEEGRAILETSFRATHLLLMAEIAAQISELNDHLKRVMDCYGVL